MCSYSVCLFLVSYEQKTLRLVVVFIKMELMNNFLNLLEKHIDFHFALAIIAILGTAGSLALQFNEANSEFETLNASAYSIFRTQGSDLKENISLNQELDELEKSLDTLNLN